MATDEIKHIVSIEADLAKIQTQIKTLEGDFTKGFKGIEAAALKIGGQLARAFGATALIGYGKSVIDLAGHIQDLSEQTGISGQTLSGLKSTLEESGTSLDAFAKGIFTAQRNLGQINEDTDAAAVAIKILGLNLNELRNASPERFLELIANALGKIENPVQRAALGAQLLGRSFQELAPVLGQIAGKFEELRKSGLSDEDIQTLDRAGDAWTRFANRLQVWVGGAFADAITDLQTINRLIRENIALFGLSAQGKAAFAGAIVGGVQQQPGAPGLADILKGAQKLKTAAPFLPLPGGSKKTVEPKDTQLLKEGIKDIAAAIDDMQEAAIKGGQAIVELSEALDREGLTPLDEKLAEINKKFDEFRQKAAAAAEATGQDLGGMERRIEFFRRQAALLAAQPTSALDIADVAEGERMRNQREEFIKLGQAALEFQERMREIAALSQVFGDGFDAVGASVSALRSEIERLISTGLSPLDPKITELKGKLDDFQSTARQADAAESFIRAAAGGITQSLQGVIQGTQSVGEAFRNMGQSILLSIADITFQLLVLEPLIKRVRQALEGGGGGGAGGFFAGLFGGGGTSPTLGPETIFTAGGEFPAIPYLQGGGIIRRQTLAMVHPNEAVVPLPKKDIFGGSNGGGIQVIVRGSIRPEPPNLSPKEVIQIISNDLDNRGITMSMIEQRSSRRG